MKAKKNYSVKCVYHENTRLYGRDVRESELTYREAKSKQKQWANESLGDDNQLDRNVRSSSIDCGDCTIIVEKSNW